MHRPVTPSVTLLAHIIALLALATSDLARYSLEAYLWIVVPQTSECSVSEP